MLLIITLTVAPSGGGACLPDHLTVVSTRRSSGMGRCLRALSVSLTGIYAPSAASHLQHGVITKRNDSAVHAYQIQMKVELDLNEEEVGALVYSLGVLTRELEDPNSEMLKDISLKTVSSAYNKILAFFGSAIN